MGTVNRLQKWKESLKYKLIAEAALLQRKQSLFIIGHMRSGSSLLVHILTSNPDIEGIGELHVRSDSLQGFGKSITAIKKEYGQKKLTGKYILNKVLHAYYLRDVQSFEKLLQRTNGKIIFLVRDPLNTIPSIIGLHLTDTDTYEKASQYYCRQLQFIGKLTDRLPHDSYFFLTYEQLVQKNDILLPALSRFLKLSVPLSSEYEVTEMTGKFSIGDPSKNILSGKILKDSEKQKQAVDYETDEAQLSAANQLYNKLRDKMNHGKQAM